MVVPLVRDKMHLNKLTVKTCGIHQKRHWLHACGKEVPIDWQMSVRECKENLLTTKEGASRHGVQVDTLCHWYLHAIVGGREETKLIQWPSWLGECLFTWSWYIGVQSDCRGQMEGGRKKGDERGENRGITGSMLWQRRRPSNVAC